MSYILDTNAVTDYLHNQAQVTRRFLQATQNGETMYLCQAVDYEIRRGLIKKNATRKLNEYITKVQPFMYWIELTDADWLKAADLWAEMRNKGRQFSDVDLLLAALAMRLNGVLVSADNDFVALTLSHENWRSGNGNAA